MLQICQNIRQARLNKGYTQQKVADLLGEKRSTYKNWEENTEPDLSKLKTIAGVLGVNLDELINREVKANNYVEQRRNNKLNTVKEGIPIYEDSPYTLGNVESYRDTPTEKADFWVTIPGLRNCNYGVRATGDSMHPLIRNHALVVGEEITDISFIPSGDIYIVRAKNGIETIKYIQTHETDPKKFVLVPYNEKAKPTDILKKDILKIWKAKAVFNVL